MIKKYFKAALITGFFAAFVIYLSVSHKPAELPDAVYGVSNASVSEILSPAHIEGFREIHGVKITYADPSKVTYFFEYEGNAQDTLKAISALPFVIDNNVSSLTCSLMESNSNPLAANKSFSEYIQEATSFFWNSQASDFTFYECVKSPLKHTVLISKTSSRILHKVESI